MWQALRYAQTLRHLRPVQIGNRISRKLFPARPDMRPPPAPRATRAAFATPLQRSPRVSADLTRFTVLNIAHDIAGPSAWTDQAAPYLWLYNLHYFDDVPARGDDPHAAVFAAFIARWIAENPPGKAPGWEPYPTSLRLVNWIKWALVGGSLPPAALHSLAVQARFLAASLEYHLLANHLWANAKALVFAGVFFQGAEAEGWRHTGEAILAREIPEQFLADGGHFELSPMYHAILTEDLLDLLNLRRAFGQGVDVTEVTEAALRWLAAMTRGDGRFPFFNDAAYGVAQDFAALSNYAARLGMSAPKPPTGMTQLLSSGYVRIAQPHYQLFVDVGELGPSYNPGHGHCDMLSFEFFAGVPVIVNTGTSTYAPGTLRLEERRTAAHNTVQVGGAEQSDLWGGFRAARRAHIVEREMGDNWFTAAHDGFRSRGVIHRRRFEASLDAVMVRDDCGGAEAVARFHLHPDIAPVQDRDVVRAGPVTLSFDGADQVRLHPGHYAPEFNRRLPNICVEARFRGTLTTRIAP
jgi:uncharacterized heparinase superfamily protein